MTTTAPLITHPVIVEPPLPAEVDQPPLTLQPRLAGEWRRTGEAAIPHRPLFDGVRRYCMFVGYPRSGHTLIAALLAAHRHVMLAIELDALRYVECGFDRDRLYQLLLERSGTNKGLTSYEYEYMVPNQWQQRFERLDVIGDKEGGMSNLRLRRRPELLDRLKDLVGVPVVVVHIVRNPFDTIATMLTRGDADHLDQAIEYYFRFAATVAEVQRRHGSDPRVEIRHEAFIARPRDELARLCAGVGVTPDEAYLRDCSAIVFDSPRRSRHSVPWTADQRALVERRMNEHPFLAGYGFDA